MKSGCGSTGLAAWGFMRLAGATTRAVWRIIRCKAYQTAFPLDQREE